MITTEILPGILSQKRSRVKRMHMIDAGCNPCEGYPHIAKFKCSRCESVSEWLAFRTISEIRKGIECQKCNSNEKSK